MAVDSIVLAHVADAITSVTGNDDYDAVADEAARLVSRGSVAVAGAQFARGSITRAELEDAVRDALND